METTETNVVIHQILQGNSTATILTGLWQMLNLVLIAAMTAGGIYLFCLLVKALRRYLRSGEVRKETAAVKKSLGAVLKAYRTQNKMTQEFVAEHLGVSRQAVSKWENGTSDPSTANLLALAKLYGVSPEELLNQIHP